MKRLILSQVILVHVQVWEPENHKKHFCTDWVTTRRILQGSLLRVCRSASSLCSHWSGADLEGWALKERRDLRSPFYRCASKDKRKLNLNLPADLWKFLPSAGAAPISAWRLSAALQADAELTLLPEQLRAALWIMYEPEINLSPQDLQWEGVWNRPSGPLSAVCYTMLGTSAGFCENWNNPTSYHQIISQLSTW